MQDGEHAMAPLWGNTMVMYIGKKAKIINKDVNMSKECDVCDVFAFLFFPCLYF